MQEDSTEPPADERESLQNLKRISEELSESEALKTAMLDAAIDGIICIDHESRILEFNKAAEGLFGRPRGSVLGKNLTDTLIPPSIRSRHRAGMARYLATGVASVLGKRLEMPAMRADGTEFPVELVITRIPTVGLPRFVGFVRDLTERRRAEGERDRLQAQMQHAQKTESLGVLAGGIAHDFNNLLTGILGNASLALTELPDDAPGTSLVREIERAAQRAADLTQQMLAYSGRGQFVVEAVQLDALVREMATLLRTVVSKDANIDLDLSPASITADATQIRQVVMNLITNASDALGGGRGTITIRTGVRHADAAYLANRYLSEERPAGAYAYVEVADNGAGMSDETAARIFDPFFSTRFTGRGLGLAAVLGIVRGHKGAIKVASTPGRGTVVEVLLPCTGEPATSCAETSRAIPRMQGLGTILVIDDEITVRTFARHVLERAGFEVRLAEDGRAGLETMLEHQAEIVAVLLDVTMPRLDGLGTLAELRRMAPTLPVLMMSGYANQEIIERFAGKGASGFIHKPFAPQSLIERLRELIPART